MPAAGFRKEAFMLSASYYYGYGFDMTYLLVIIGAVLCLAAQGYVKSTYSRYAKRRRSAFWSATVFTMWRCGTCRAS